MLGGDLPKDREASSRLAARRFRQPAAHRHQGALHNKSDLDKMVEQTPLFGADTDTNRPAGKFLQLPESPVEEQEIVQPILLWASPQL
jgi:hypothetical protein